jgi:hypothetical protein
MSNPVSNAFKNLIINTHLRGAATPHVALYTANPNFVTSAGGTEATGGSYARAAIAFIDPASTPGITESTAAIEFTVGTNLAAGTYTGFAIMSASSGGTLLKGKAFASNRVVSEAGDKIRFAAGEITFTVANVS